VYDLQDKIIALTNAIVDLESRQRIAYSHQRNVTIMVLMDMKRELQIELKGEADE
jgi:predicted transport protein